MKELPGESLEEGADLAPHLSTPPCKLDRDGRQSSDGRSGTFSGWAAQLREMFAAGASDNEMASALGVKLCALKARRQKLRLLRPAKNLEWAEAKISALIDLWGGPLTTQEIADRLGMTKSAVIGKAHRLGLPKRPSPLKPRKAPKPIVWTFHNIGPEQCRFPHGHVGDEGFHMCGAPAIRGKSYCQDHHARCTLKPSHDKGEPFHIGKLIVGKEAA